MDALLHSPLLQNLALLLVVIAIDSLWRWPPKYHPLTVFRLLAAGMATKVKPKSTDSPSQHRISGALGAIVLIVPFTVLTGLLVTMAEYPLFFEAVILLCVMDSAQVRWHYNAVVTALGREKKVLAREMVSHIVARDCDRLSDIGIAKAAMESLLLRSCYQFCGVVLWFLIAGPVAALLYRLLLLFSWQWHWRKPGFYWFALPVRRVTRLLSLVPAFTGAILLALSTHPVAGFKALSQAKSRDSTSLLLALCGGSLGIRLGGPAIYSGNMIRYSRVGGHREVRFSDMTHCRQAVTRAVLLLLGVAVVIFSALHALYAF